MADKHSAPSQADQASERSKAEGERDIGRDEPRTSRGGLDPGEAEDVLDETGEKRRGGDDIGPSGTSNPTLAEEQEGQADLSSRKTRKTGGGA